MFSPVAPPPDANAEKLVADLPAVPEKVGKGGVGSTVIEGECLRETEEIQMKRECGLPEDMDLELVPTFVEEGPDDGWLPWQGAGRTKVGHTF